MSGRRADHEARAAAMRADAMRSLVPLYAALDGLAVRSTGEAAGVDEATVERGLVASAIVERKLHDGSPLPRGVQR